MNEIERQQAFQIWNHWLDHMLSHLMGMPEVAFGPDHIEMATRALAEDWRLEPLSLTTPAKWTLYQRLRWAWAAVKHASQAGWQAPAQPLSPWRLHLLLSDWPRAAPVEFFQLAESGHPACIQDIVFGDGQLEALRLWWPRLLAEHPPSSAPPWLE